MDEDAIRLSATSLATYVGAKNPDDPFAEQCWSEAVALVNRRCGKDLAAVPDGVLDRAYLEVGAELYHRRATKNGAAQFAVPDAQPIRIARDPLVSAYPLIDPYLGPGIG